ncbi:MAG: pilus assembly protein [Pseudomonadota bacterium]
MLSRIASSIATRTKRLIACERANISVLFALSLVPILGFVGAAVDYSRANAVKSSMQAAADSAALLLSKDVATLASGQIQTKANDFFKANFTRAEAQELAVSAVYKQDAGSEIVLSASSTVATSFMGLLGQASMKVAVTSQVKWGSTKLRVALVLDTTGSMDNAGKMTAMQTATKNLLAQLQSAAASNGDVYVSIIPFSKNVNVGAANYNATWIDWTDWEAEPKVLQGSKPSNWSEIGPGDSCPFTTSAHGFRCAPTPTSTSTTSTIPSSGTYAGYICPSSDTGGKDSTKIGIIYNGCYNSVLNLKTVSSGSGASCGSYNNCTCSGSGSSRVCKQETYDHTWIKNARSTWNGCVTERGTSSGPSNDYDRKVTAPSSSTPASLFPAEQNSYCSPQITQLNYNWSSMKSTVDALYPLGATNQPIGLVWGWQSLVGGGPIAAPPAKDSRYTYNEVIVLMSDGLNTLNRWYGNGSSVNTSVDRRMHESAAAGTCANIKASGITIYTVHVNTDGDPKSTLLENCASTSDKFWMVTSASGLSNVFSQIGTQLSNLRIAQ